jgi:drug/metabolite transporter (DMT)-like permease
VSGVRGAVRRSILAGAALAPFGAALVLCAVALADGVVLTLDEGFVVEATWLGSVAAALSVASLALGFVAVRTYTSRRGEPPWTPLLP